MFQFKPDYAEAKARIDAFWQREIIDRPIVQFHVAKSREEQVELPVSRHATTAERWMDAQFQAELALARLSNAEYLGETLPIAYPNLGPEIFSSFYGCPINFGDYGTSWTEPIIEDWSQAEPIALDENSPYLLKLEEMTDAYLAVAEDKFIVGMTDWHPGGDWLAGLRDPQNLAMDMIMYPEEVKAALEIAEKDYFRLYDRYYAKLREAGHPITSWLTLISDGKYYIPSNDFSAMVSPAMYDEFFLPGIRRECQFLDASIYHLDGPGALRHLDSILSIPELNAVQWVFGAGNEGYHRWVDVYHRIQSAGKGAQVICAYDEIPQVLETLQPEGLFLSVSGVPDREAGLDLLKRLEQWTAGRIHPTH